MSYNCGAQPQSLGCSDKKLRQGQIQAQVHSSTKERRVIGPRRQTLAARLGRVGISQIRRTTAKHITSRHLTISLRQCTKQGASYILDLLVLRHSSLVSLHSCFCLVNQAKRVNNNLLWELQWFLLP